MKNQSDKKNWFARHKILTGVFALILIVGVAANAASKNPKLQVATTEEQPKINVEKPITIEPVKVAETEKKEVPKKVEPPKTEFVFDVPSLLGKNIDEIRLILGAPTDKDVDLTPIQLEISGDKDIEWYNHFEKDNKTLLVTYQAKSRKVVDFFISSTGFPQDKNLMMKIGNLQNNDSQYNIEFVKALKDPNIFTGVKIAPKN